MESMEFRVERQGRGWRLVLPWDGAEQLLLDLVGARVDADGTVRGALTIRIGTAITYRTTANLTSERARRDLRQRLAARGMFIEDAPLIALDEACRTRAARAAPPPRPGGPAEPLATLLDDLDAILARFVVFPSRAQRTAVTLWTPHTHALEAFDTTGYLNVQSPEKRSGKSRLLEVLTELVPRPEYTSRLTEATTFRLIESAAGPPVLLIDEADTIFSGKPDERTEALRALLDAGWRRGLTVPRCVGPTHEVRRFPTFCAKVLSGIARRKVALPDTVADRSIPIVLARRKRSEPVEKFRIRSTPALLQPLRDQLAAWAATAVATLQQACPTMPPLHDRAEDIWEPLLAIADLAGGAWPARARTAALELNGDESDTESTNVELLRAIKEVFAAAGVPKLLTIDLLVALIERESEPWPGWWGKEVDQAVKNDGVPRSASQDLARHLRPFGIGPKSVRVPDGPPNRGYDLADFADAFARYLPEIDLSVFAAAVAEWVCLDSEQLLKRHNATSLVPQGFEAWQPAFAGTEDATPQPLVPQGLWRCGIQESSGVGADTNRGTTPGGPVGDREPGEDDGDDEDVVLDGGDAGAPGEPGPAAAPPAPLTASAPGLTVADVLAGVPDAQVVESNGGHPVAENLGRCPDVVPEIDSERIAAGTALFETARALDFLVLELRQGIVVGPGEAAWRQFSVNGTADDQAQAREAFTRRAGPAAAPAGAGTARAQARRRATTKTATATAQEQPPPPRPPERPLWQRRPPRELDAQDAERWANCCRHVDPDGRAYAQDSEERAKWSHLLEQLDELAAHRRFAGEAAGGDDLARELVNALEADEEED